MLDVNPKTRITASQAINHPWIEHIHCELCGIDHTKPVEHDKHIINNLLNYKGKSVLKRAAINTLVKTLKNTEI